MNIPRAIFHLLIFLLTCGTGAVLAHYPHDVTSFITLSPNYGVDSTVFLTQKQGSSIRPHVALVTRDGGYTWEYNPVGMNNKSKFTSAAVSPLYASDNKVYMTSQSDGVFFSSDAGVTWVQINQGLPTNSIKDSATALDGSNAVQLFVSGASGGLFRTGDSGASWQIVLDSTVAVATFALSPAYAFDSTIIVGDAAGVIHMSTDGGASFTQNNGLQSVGVITRISFSPDYASSGEIIVGTSAGLYRSVDWGQTYTQIQSFVSEQVFALTVSPNYVFDQVIFAATAMNVYRSTDGGASWNITATEIELSPQSLAHFYDLQTSESFAADGVVYLAAFEGVFISTDSGINWEELDPRTATLVMGVAMSPTYEQDGLILVSTYGGGLYITDDAGLNWHVSNTGVSNTYTYQVEIREGADTTPVMVASQQNHVLVSTDLGASWTRKIVHGVLPSECIPSAMDVSHTFATDQSILLGCRQQGIVMTEDGGDTWQLLVSSAQLNGGTVSSVRFSTNYALDSTIFAADSNGVFGRSTDGGVTWSPIGNGLPAPGNWFGGTAITLSNNFAVDRIMVAATPTGLYASGNRGNDWSPIPDGSSPVATGIIESGGVSPNFSNDQMALASVRGQGLFRTMDSGQSWQSVGSGLLDENNELKTFVFSPNFAVDGEIVGFGHDRILRSTDQGLSFQAMDIPFVRHEDDRKQSVGFTGNWSKSSFETASGTTIRSTQTPGNEAKLSFVGTGISWIGVKSSELGIAEVYLDGVLVDTVDQYSPTTIWQEELFSLQNLPLDLHEIRVRATNAQNENSTNNITAIDAFDVTR